MTVASPVLLGHGGLGLGHRLLPRACPGVTLAGLEADQLGVREAGEAPCGGYVGGSLLAGVGVGEAWCLLFCVAAARLCSGSLCGWQAV